MHPSDIEQLVQRRVAEALEKELSKGLVDLFRKHVSLTLDAEPHSPSPGVYQTQITVGLRLDGVTFADEKIVLDVAPASPAPTKRRSGPY